MNPTELLNRLEAEGVGVSLNLKVTADEKPSDDTRALIRENRDVLLEHLAVEFYRHSNASRVTHLQDGANYAHARNYQHAGNLQLYGELLHSLMVWTARYHELRISHPNGLTLNATPEHVRDAAKLHPWGVVYDPERYLLMSWGDVPRVTLLGLRDLETGELLIPEQVAA